MEWNYGSGGMVRVVGGASGPFAPKKPKTRVRSSEPIPYNKLLIESSCDNSLNVLWTEVG